tara:strand:+ start:984 stop:1106 length:123 start_codon:yes stop_codon:yes gene_type:complete
LTPVNGKHKIVQGTSCVDSLPGPFDNKKKREEKKENKLVK